MQNNRLTRSFLARKAGIRRTALLTVICLCSAPCHAQAFPHDQLVRFEAPHASDDFPVARPGHVAAIYLAPADEPALGASVEAFASDLERVTGIKPRILHTLDQPLPEDLILVGIAGHSPELNLMQVRSEIDTAQIQGKWESALTTVIEHPAPAKGVRRLLVVVGSDRRGAAFALFTLSRQMGVSPWYWWADVPVAHHETLTVHAHNEIQAEPSVQYRGIFLNDEDWGLRPWAAEKMDPHLKNIGPHTYDHIFELLLRLHANSLWPAMHPGSLPFNAVPENARLADKWGIVMGSSHSEALLRNNVGEWSEAAPPKGDGPWNYQTNRNAMDAYWDKRLAVNGKFENFYTVGLRGVHDTGLEATGSPEVKARLVEQAMNDQRAILARHVNPDVTKVPQVIWLYKESLALYRAGMQVPPDVTLGWTDDNYGYIRQLPTTAEQQRPGGSGLYYHVSYWGFPHDYLWLCSTPPALMQEELTKAFDHGVRRYWVLNVGDIKPAEIDIDYFMQLAWNEPAMAKLDQTTFLAAWAAEQFPASISPRIASVMDRHYYLNFIRRPEFMGFNGYNDGINRTAFNPNAWGDQNAERLRSWIKLAGAASSVGEQIPPSAQDAFFELVGYPVEASADQNEKILFADRTFLDAEQHNSAKLHDDARQAELAFNSIRLLTNKYNALENGKWHGMMSAAPRERHVFEMPALATPADTNKPLPSSWAPDESHTPPPPTSAFGFVEQHGTVSIAADHFAHKSDGTLSQWNSLPNLGISGGSAMVLGAPGLLANQPPSAALAPDAPWLEYEFTTISNGPATLTLHLLPTFPIDSAHRLRFGVAVDDAPPTTLDLAGSGEWQEGNAPTWEDNVRRNSAIMTLPLPQLKPGHHTVRLLYLDPGVVFEHLVVTFPGAPPAYPVPPETRR
jgi:hypothetical protein